MRNPFKLTAILMVVLVAIVLVALNPEMPDFQDFVASQSERLLADKVGDSVLGQIFSGAGGSLLGGVVDQVTERDNYVLFSIYTIDLDGPDETANEWKFLGIADHFFQIKRPEELNRQD